MKTKEVRFFNDHFMELVIRHNTSIFNAALSYQITEKNYLAKMKKELILMRKEMEREKISIAELRNANAKRQKDGLFDVKKLEKKLTKKLTRRLTRKLEKYFANSSSPEELCVWVYQRKRDMWERETERREKERGREGEMETRK